MLVTVIFAGQDIVGFSLSVTVTVIESVPVKDAPSVTVYVIVVTPIGKIYVPTCPEPLAVTAPVIAQVNVLPVQLSLKVAAGITLETVQSPVLSKDVVVTISVEAVTVGFSLSVTVTVKLQVNPVGVPPLPLSSKVFVVTPTGKIDPEAKPEICATVYPETSEVGEPKVTTAVQSPGSLFSLMFDGQPISVAATFKSSSFKSNTSTF